MDEKSAVFVGVDIMRASGRLRRAFVYASLDADREMLAIGHGDRNEVLAYLGGQQSAFVSINAPRAPNSGIINREHIYQDELPFAKPVKQINARLCEYLLKEMGLKIDTTPNKATNCPSWMKRGFNLYQRLGDFGYAPFPNQNGLHNSLETHADGIFWRLLNGKHPLPASLEGRLQRQLILHKFHMPVPDAMEFFVEITRFKLMQGELPDQDIHTFEELNALAAAYIAWQAALHPDEIELFGDPDEGQLALPIGG